MSANTFGKTQPDGWWRSPPQVSFISTVYGSTAPNLSTSVSDERARRQRLLQEVRRLQRDQSRLIDLSRRAVEGEDDALLRLREWLDQERKE